MLVAPTVWLLKDKLAGERLTAAPVPVPVRLTFCGLPATLSTRTTPAVKVPLVAGVNVTLMEQLLPAAKLDPQVFVSAKVDGFAPVSATLEMLSAALPVLVSVMV